jgi:two-component system, NtrC family, nitrogen regulation response regulator GlnG
MHRAAGPNSLSVASEGSLLPELRGDATEPLMHRRLTPDAVKLVVLSGASEGLERGLSATMTLGADPRCDLNLRDRGISRNHAEFRLHEGRVWVRDLGSRNGTLLNGVRVNEAELSLGSVVQLGEIAVGLYPRWHIREVDPSVATRFGHLYGTSLPMRNVFAILERVASSHATVLVEGESGTGKELVARSLHEASSRARKPYVIFDCTTVTKELAESELFGHVKGAFSGAVSDRDGAFQQADGGTIFLDELGELPLDLQPKLLRVLESGETRRVGDSQRRRVDVRVLAATNRDLHAEARRGRFRSDLLYRLSVVRLQLPPLRSRPEDIAVIAERLLEGQLAPGSRVEGANLERLMSYSFPGNVRELRNVLTRALALTPRRDGLVAFDELVLNLASDSSSPTSLGYGFPGVDAHLPYKEAKQRLMAQFDDEYVQALMRRNGGNVTQAAKAADLSRKHVYALLRRVELDAEADAPGS